MLNIVVKHKKTPVKSYRISKDGSTVGRLQTNDVVINNIAVSRNHLKIELPEEGKYARIIDLESLNGTYHNNEKIKELTIEDEAEITIGDFSLFLTFGSPFAHPASKSKKDPAPESRTSSPPHTDDTPSDQDSSPDGRNEESDEAALIFSASDKNKNTLGGEEKRIESKGILIEVERQIVYKINKTIMTFGNTDDDDIYIEGGMLSSGKVAVLKVVDDSHIIKASNKITGKFKINGKKVSEATLQHGDKIKIGSSKFSFMLKTG
ncbi:MAG: FHA domain-containing protein [Fibrobacterota bacterium]